MSRARKIVDPDFVEALDNIVPREITDEILKEMLVKREVEELHKFTRSDGTLIHARVWKVDNVHYRATQCDKCHRLMIAGIYWPITGNNWWESYSRCEEYNNPYCCYGEPITEPSEHFRKIQQDFWKRKL